MHRQAEFVTKREATHDHPVINTREGFYAEMSTLGMPCARTRSIVLCRVADVFVCRVHPSECVSRKKFTRVGGDDKWDQQSSGSLKSPANTLRLEGDQKGKGRLECGKRCQSYSNSVDDVYILCGLGARVVAGEAKEY